MKTIEIDDDLYAFIAGQTKHIGESASDILRRLLLPESPSPLNSVTEAEDLQSSDDSQPSPEPVMENVADTLVAHGEGDIITRLNDETIAGYTKRVDLFLFILSELHDLHPDAFAEVEQIKGKNRTYFATSKDALLQNGSSTNPKQIPDSPYWVVTNNNTAKKVAMLQQVMESLGYSEDTIQTTVKKFA